MRKLILIAVVVVFTLLLACGPAAPAPAPEPAPAPTPTPSPAPAPTPVPEVPPEKAHLTPNPVETAMPQYGGYVTYGGDLPANFDQHYSAASCNQIGFPVFNSLVMYDNTYKEPVPENIIGDLAESWEVSADGTEITFHIHQGVKWHDGLPCTADDVVYSLDKMNDVNRSAIIDLFPAYESAEKIDDYTVKVHLKYASAGYMTGLASGYAVIQAKHLAGTDSQSVDFMIGTGPFILDDYKVRVHVTYKRNPDYFKKDKYGNQLPYLNGLIILSTAQGTELLIARRVDMKSPSSSLPNISDLEYCKASAPEVLYQPKLNHWGAAFFLNMDHKPLDDVRVRRAMGLVIVPEEMIIGYSGDPSFGIPGQGLLNPSYGLPKEETAKLMGWDKPMEERVAEAKKLMAEAGYPNGFTLNMMSSSRAATAASGYIGTTLVYAEALRKHLNMDCEVHGLAGSEVTKRRDEGNYDLYTKGVIVGEDPAQLITYFGKGGYENYSNYVNPQMDKMLSELDHQIDPKIRQGVIWDIERLLLTDLPALPTGAFPTNYMAYYPHVKNLRWMNMSYSNILRFEDIWIDQSLRPADFGTKN